jgi:prophage regulatory protein
MTERFLRLPQVEDRVGLKKTAIYDLIKDGDFPAQIKLGRRYTVWPESAIEGWIQEKIVQAGNNLS